MTAAFEWAGHSFPAGRRVLLDLYGTDRHPGTWARPGVFDPERFRDRIPTPFDLVPQGGGDHRTGHRCAGEWITIAVMTRAVQLLSRMTYRVPPQDLRVSTTPDADAAGQRLRPHRRGLRRRRYSCFCSARPSSCLFMSRVAGDTGLLRACTSSSRVLPSTSTPPNVSPLPARFSAVEPFDRGSDGPFSSLSSQWSPTFSATCLTDAQAVRCARASSPSYCSSALSRVSVVGVLDLRRRPLERAGQVRGVVLVGGHGAPLVGSRWRCSPG